MKKMLMIGTLAASLFAGSNTTFAAGKVSLSDIDVSWAKDRIEQAIDLGIVDGFEDGTFRPFNTVTRAQFLKMVITTLRIPVSAQQAGEDWYMPYVAAGKEAGIFQEDDFAGDWNDNLSRLEMSRMAVRGLDKEKLGANDAELLFEATKRGIITGLINGELGKEENSNRAQAAIVIGRLLDLQAGQTLEVDKRAMSYAEVEMSGTNIQTMWGIKAYPLPQDGRVGSGVESSIDKILIIDMTDDEGAYRSWVPDLMRNDRKDPSSDYVIALQFHLKNPGNGSGYFSLIGTVFAGDDFVRSLVPAELNDQTPFKLVGQADQLNESWERDQWFLMNISKETMDSKLKANKFFGLTISTKGTDGNFFKLSENSLGK